MIIVYAPSQDPAESADGVNEGCCSRSLVLMNEGNMGEIVGERRALDGGMLEATQ